MDAVIELRCHENQSEPSFLLAMPFTDDAPMLGPASYAVDDLKTPRLRRCPFDLEADKLVFDAGQKRAWGVDGVVWKVYSGDKGPFALKVVSQALRHGALRRVASRPPCLCHSGRPCDPRGSHMLTHPLAAQFWDRVVTLWDSIYWAAQRECQNAAVLQMMQASLAAGPVELFDSASLECREEQCARVPYDWSKGVKRAPPGTWRCQKRIRQNYLAFSKESKAGKKGSGKTKTISSMPRMAKCYGWLDISGETLYSETMIDNGLYPPYDIIEKLERSMARDEEHFAIVYEWLDEGRNEPAIVEEVADFLTRVGFCFVLITKRDNWRQGVLVDHSDVVCYRGYGWTDAYHEMKTRAADLLCG
jgi:hypothetical protein